MNKKLALVLILITLMIASFASIGTVQFGRAQTGTQVSGIISSDTTWTKANSPYTFSGPLTVNSGITLAVKPGVTINLNSFTLSVLGTFSAQGSDIDKIYINGLSGSTFYQIIFNQSSTSWREQTQTGSIIQESIINVTSIYIDNASPKINHNSIGGANVLINGSAPTVISTVGGSPMISNNTMTPSFKNSALEIIGGAPTVSKNSIINPYSVSTGIYIFKENNAFVYENDINGFARGIWVNAGSPTIERNNIANNAIAISIGGDSPVKVIIQNNTITKNEVGISFGNYDPSSTLRFNNVETGSSTWVQPRLVDLSDDFGGPTYTINAVDNWWGTSDAAIVNQTISQKLVNMGYGGHGIIVTANVIPILTFPNPQALPEITDPPAELPIPSPYPTANPTPTPSPTPSSVPTPTASPSAIPISSPSPTETPTSSPNGIEVATLTGIIVIIGLLIAILALTIRKNQSRIQSE